MNEDTYESFVPHYVLEWLAGDDEPGPAEMELDRATLLFADISGSTSLGEQLASQGRGGAEEMVRRLNGTFGMLIDVVHDRGGDTTGFAGDSLMAYWPGDAVEAIEAALEIQRRQRELDIASVELSIRISVGLGSVRRLVLGGRSGRWHVAVTGTALNDAGLASDVALPNEVVVSAAVASVLGERYPGEVVGGGCVRLTPTEALTVTVEPEPVAAAPVVDPARLRAFVPTPVLAHLDAGRQDWLAELRPVTVVFASLPDLGSDTPLMVVHQLIQEAQRAITQFDASLNKINVDEKGIAVLAALGMPPRAHEDDAARGARLAMELARTAQEAGVRCYVGVCTGRVFCGTVGNSTRREYTLTGTTVNRAARLMVHAMQVDANTAVLADEATTAMVAAMVSHTVMPPVELKGIGRSVPTRLHVWSDDGSVAPERHTTFIGRADESARLRTMIASSNAGPAPIAVIEGEPGIGKSTLADLGVRAARAARMRVVRAAGDSIEESRPYAPIKALFRQLLDLPTGDLAEQRRLVLQQLGPGLGAQAALLSDVLPVPFPRTAETMDLPADAGASIVQSLTAAALGQIAGHSTTLLHLEDFHWFDAASVAVISEIAATRRVGLLITGRPSEPLAAIAALPGALHLELGPLDRSAIGSLVAATLHAARADDRVIDAVFARGEGHPLFSQELARVMAQHDLLEFDDEGVIAPRPRVDLETASLPDSVEGIIAQRIDRLPPSEQVTLKAASVIGTAFDLETLRAVHPEGRDHEAALTRSLALLGQYDLAIPDGVGYRFVHALTRDVAYDRLPFSQRATLHEALAEWYERSLDPDSVIGRLAYHWEHCWLSATAIERPPVDVAHVQAKAADALEKACNAAGSAGLLYQAVQLGLRATRVLGVRLPTEPDAVGPAIGAELERIGELFGTNDPDQLLGLQPLTNDDIGRAVLLILRVQPSAAMTQDRDMFALLALRNYTLVLEHGLGTGAPGAIAVFGSLELLMTGDAARAHQRTSIALAMAQGGPMFSYVAFVHSWLVNHWHRPIAEIIETCDAASTAGFAVGDVMFGSFSSAALVVSAAMMGKPLDEVIVLADKYAALIDGRVHSAAFHCRHERQVAMALAGATSHPRSLSDDVFTEEGDIASILETPSMNQIGAYLASKGRLEYLYRDYEAAVVYGEQTTQLLEAMSGQLLEVEFIFFHTLALLQRSAEDGVPNAADLRGIAAAQKERVQQWAANCPPNFEHKLGIIDGVEAWVDGDPVGAAATLDAAAAAAAAAGFVQHEALAHELAAQARRTAGDDAGALHSAGAAADAYRRWGAFAKVDDVTRQFPALTG